MPWPNSAINTIWQNAVTYRPHDPLAVDLDGDGIETVGITTNPILFDHNGDGIRTGTGWLKGDDAWLVRDLNGNGQIDSGAELFGIDTVVNGTYGQRNAYSGFEALAALDTGDGSTMTTAAGYKDNVFDAKDAAFSQVRVWQDLNQNGISEANELSTLADKGIVSISLAATSDTVNLGNGNTVTGKATVTKTTGTTTIDSVAVTSETAGNLGLATNGFYRSFTDTVPLTDAAKALPEMRGSGFVRDLREASSLSPELAGIVNQFAQASTRATQMALVDSLLELWAKSSGKYDTPKTVEPIKMEVVGDTSTQQTWHITVMEPDQAAIVMAGDIVYDAMAYSFSANSPYMSTGTNEATHLPYDYVNATGMEVLRKKSVLEVFNGQRFVDITQVFNKGSNSGGGLSSGGGDGGGGDGKAQMTGPRIVMGSVISQPQVDLLTQAYEELRQSVYSGLLLQTRLAPYLDAVQLVIDDQGIHFDTTALDTKFNQAFTANQQEAMLDLLDMNLYAQDTLQAVGFNGVQKLKGWLDGLATDSPIWSTLNAAGLLPTGTTTGTVYRDLGFGQDTTEMLRMGSGNDLVFAQGGNDMVWGEDGDDTLDGGAGNDCLYGGNGADTYLFGRGSGQDTIGNSDNDAAGTAPDTIQLQYDIAPSDVKLTRSGNDLIITINGTADSLRVNSYFNADGDTPYAVDNIKFSDFTIWDVAAVKAIVQMGTAGNDTIYGYAVGDTISAGSGNDTIYGYAGADLINGGKGDDSIEGGNDADTLIGGAGKDALYGGNGADTYVLGRGAAQDTVYNFDNDAVNSDADSIQLDADILPSEVALKRYADDLIISINGTDDSLRVNNYFSADGASSYAIENIKFANSTVWDIAAIKTLVQAGTAGKDTLYGYAASDTLSAADSDDMIYGYAGNDQLDGGSGNDTLQGGDDTDTLNGGAGNDSLYGGNGGDSLQGGGNNDYLYGEAGNDTLDGGAGNDYLFGANGADTYLFGKGSGQDTVRNGNDDSDAVGVNADTILLSSDITVNDITLTRISDDLLISINGTDDSLSVYNYFSLDGTSSSVVENLRFAGDTVWNYATVKSHLTTSTPTQGFTTNGSANGELLTGGLRNDALYGNEGNDTLDGGAGNDLLSGGAGNDTYVFAKGNGKDTVSSNDTTPGKVDVVSFAADIGIADVVLTRNKDDLLISISGSSDSLQISNYFVADATGGSQVEQIKFADGPIWDVNTVKVKALSATADNDVLTGYSIGDTITGLAGDDTIRGMNGADNLDGGTGSDSLNGDDGTDTIHGGAQGDFISGDAGADALFGDEGDDVIYGGSDNDTLDGGAGNDLLSGEAGNDTYIFAVDGGKDTIAADNDTALAKLNVLQVLTGISAGDLSFDRSGENLLIARAGSSDSITVNRFFYNNDPANSSNPVQQVQFAEDGVTWSSGTVQQLAYAALANDTTSGTSVADKIYGLDDADTITGLDGTDFLFGNDGADSLLGGAETDWLFGGNDADTLDGGLGADTMAGGAGDDYYYVEDQSDAVIELVNPLQPFDFDTVETLISYTAPRNVEALIAGGEDDINLTANDDGCELYGNIGNNHIKGGANTDVLTGGGGLDTMEGGAGDDFYLMFDNKAKVIENAGGGYDQILAYANNITMADNVEKLTMATNAPITATGNDSNNYIAGNGRGNILSGMKGNDKLFGKAGNDTLTGGIGDDTVDGGSGDDQYMFNAGDGADTIVDTEINGLNSDQLTFLGSIRSDQLWFAKSGNNLQISVIGTSDKVTINNWYLGDSNKVESVTAQGNGKTLSYSKVDNLVNAMAGFAAPTAGQTTLPTSYQSALNSVIASSWS